MTRAEALQIAKPILFNTEMVRAILGGTKTVTRRLIKPRYDNTHIEIITNKYGRQLVEIQDDVKETVKPNGTHCRQLRAMRKITSPYKVGDILYVRETWAYRYCWECEQQGVGDECELERQKFKNAPFGEYGCYKFPDEYDEPVDHQWHSAASMPKEATRIFLRVTGVRVERLQDIITGDYRTTLNIKSEGLTSPCCYCILNGECEDFITQGSCRLFNEFIKLWNSTIKKSDLNKYGWDANPWVRVIEFERLEVTE